MKHQLFATLIICLFFSTMMSLAQSSPTVELIPSQTRIQSGETVTIEVVIRNGLNVGGLDVGIGTDGTCLRLINREAGNYLPMTEAEGAFSSFSVINPADTRLAIALTDRTKHVSGDGTFYRVSLEAICQDTAVPITISYAQVSSYRDPSAEIIEVDSYDLSDSSLSIINTLIYIGDVAEADVQANSEVSVASTDSANTSEAVVQDNEAPDAFMFIIMMSCIVSILLVAIFLFSLRKSKKSKQE